MVELFRVEVTERGKRADKPDNFTEVTEDFSELLNTELFQIGPGRFMSLMKKK